MNDVQPGDVLGKFSTADWIMSAGAAWIFFVVYFIGNRLQEEYGSSALIIVAPLALALLLAVFVRHGSESAWNALYPGTINLAGTGIAVFALLDLFNGLSNEFSSSGEFYEITLYVAAAAIVGGMIQARQEAS